MKRKMTSFLLVVSLCALIAVNVQAKTNVSPTIDRIQSEGVVLVETSEYYESEKSKNKDVDNMRSNKVNSKGLKLYYNDNKEIKNDIILADDSSKTGEQKQKLVAVLEDSSNNTIHYYFSDNLSASDKSTLNEITSDIEKISESKSDSTLMKSFPNPDTRDYTWSFYGGESKVQTILSTTVDLTRLTSNALHEGKPCSIWDVGSHSQYRKVNATFIEKQTTRLDVSFPDESLHDYGPTQNTSGGTITFGLTWPGLPSASYQFNIDGFSVKDLSKLEEDYGRWEFYDKIGLGEPKFTTQPAIRAINTQGDFIVELSHVVNFRLGPYGTRTGQTGVIQIYAHDR